MKTSDEILKEYNEKEMCTDIVEMDGKLYYSELDTLCLMERYEEQFKPVCEDRLIKKELQDAIIHESTEEEAQTTYLETVKDYLRPILIEFNKYIESSVLEEYECSEDWMIEENVNHFLKDYEL